MSVVGYVGTMGSGKTRAVVARGLDARRDGRDLYANFRFGDRVAGYMVPVCKWGVHAGRFHEGHEQEGYTFEVEPLRTSLAVIAKARGWRHGQGFVAWPDANVLRSWDQLQALRVFWDELGAAHRGQLREVDGAWTCERACEVWDCKGCSKGVTVLIDELNLWAPSRLWQELGLGVLSRWAYARKDGMDIVWSAQHEARVDKVAREVTDYIWACRAFGGRFGRVRLQLFHRQKWVPAMLTEKNRSGAGEGAQGAGITGFDMDWVVRFGSQLATREERSYDTYEHVADSGHLSEAAERRAERGRSRAPRRVA